jgi:hypothetical protein
VDKQLPATAYLNKEFLSYYNNPIVEFKQANLTNTEQEILKNGTHE